MTFDFERSLFNTKSLRSRNFAK